MCPFCADEGVAWIGENGWTGRRCAGCGLIFISPRPTRAAVAALYESDNAYLPADLFLSGRPSPAAQLANRRTVRLLRLFASGRRLLEIGPGAGDVLAEARRAGFEPHGVEANPAQAEHIRARGIPCVQRIEDLDAESFDVVYHRDVLSHFYDPVDEFERVHGLLEPGGIHAFETGNLGDVDRRWFAYFKSFQYPDHLFFFSTKSIRLLLERTGFELVHIDRTSIVPGMWQARQLRRLRGAAEGGGSVDGHAPPRQLRRSSLAATARQALDLSRYLADATIGRIRPSATAPQTMVVVARRI